MKSSLPGHDGQPPGAGALLLGDPGTSIGALLSVTTELTTTGRKRSSEDARRLAGRIVLSMLGGGFGLIIAAVLVNDPWVPAGAVVGVLLAQLRFIRPRHTTTFVGTEGL